MSLSTANKMTFHDSTDHQGFCICVCLNYTKPMITFSNTHTYIHHIIFMSHC